MKKKIVCCLKGIKDLISVLALSNYIKEFKKILKVIGTLIKYSSVESNLKKKSNIIRFLIKSSIFNAKVIVYY